MYACCMIDFRDDGALHARNLFVTFVEGRKELRYHLWKFIDSIYENVFAILRNDYSNLINLFTLK